MRDRREQTGERGGGGEARVYSETGEKEGRVMSPETEGSVRDKREWTGERGESDAVGESRQEREGGGMRR